MISHIQAAVSKIATRLAEITGKKKHSTKMLDDAANELAKLKSSMDKATKDLEVR